MSKAVIKIVKRYQEIIAAPRDLNGHAKAEKNSERGMADAVTVWISECRRNKRAEEVSALGKIFAWKNESEIFGA